MELQINTDFKKKKKNPQSYGLLAPEKALYQWYQRKPCINDIFIIFLYPESLNK